MKKIIAILTVLTLITLSMISCGEGNNTPAADPSKLPDDIPIIDTTPSGNEKPVAPGSSYVYSRGSLTLAKDAVYENGKLVLYFNEALDYNKALTCYIGLQSAYDAESVKAFPDTDAYPDMTLEDGGFNGIALVPAEPITAGTYNVIVSIGTYVVENFEFTFE